MRVKPLVDVFMSLIAALASYTQQPHLWISWKALFIGPRPIAIFRPQNIVEASFFLAPRKSAVRASASTVYKLLVDVERCQNRLTVPLLGQWVISMIERSDYLIRPGPCVLHKKLAFWIPLR